MKGTDNPRDILLRPVISEKSYGLLDEGKYTFIVAPEANKTEVRLAVEQVFGVKVTGVNTVHRRQARRHQAGDRHPGRGRADRHLRRPGPLAAGTIQEI